jgi:5-methylcytosine-specific restriction endonuclease McrA
MTSRTTTLAIDFGSRYIGLALVEHNENAHNRVLYAGTVVVEPKPLKALVETRAGTRRLRRTRKTHERRSLRLSQALAGVANAESIVRFCRRRGYSHDGPEENDDQTFHIPREVFFEALNAEIGRIIPDGQQQHVKEACARHLNLQTLATRELRPARFENRGRSRCNWEGCRHNVPRAGNDVRGRLQQTLFLWLQPVFGESQNVPRLQKSIQHWIDELAALSKAYRATTDEENEEAPERKRVNKRILRVFKLLRERVHSEASPETAEKFDDNWKDYYREQVTEIVRGKAGGRVRYCKEHSVLFVEYVMAGRQIPNEQEIHARDLISRTQQIVFQRIARLVEGRILPLAGGRINKIVVERVAFDVLSGPINARQKLSEDKAAEIYWYGPQAGFDSRSKMLEAEFDGRCAYCGEQAPTAEVEHIFNRSDFPFDSYFNVVPSCRNCNARKGSRTALQAGMTIHETAYNAYCDYLHSIRVLHPYHTIKKGILNLLRRATLVDRGQQMIGLIADNLVSITNTQRSPRPLARYLATQLKRLTGNRPTIGFSAGRHTALYRSVMLPAYEKKAEKAAGDLRNHAVDAVILGCDLPSTTALENSKWTKSRTDVEDWMQNVKAASPQIADGLPRVEPIEFVQFFENDAGAGYCTIDLSAFNWNRRRKAAHKLDPFGKTGKGVPVKRIPAANVMADLLKGAAVRDKQIAAIAHRKLRTTLANNCEQAAQSLVEWLQQSTNAGLANGNMSAHPADRERLRLLETFVNTPVAEFLKSENPAAIPWVIGIRCLNQDTGSARKVNVRRQINGESAVQFYQSEAVIREMYVGYGSVDGQIDRRHPILFAVSQIDELSAGNRGRWTAVAVPPESPLRGRTLGTGESLKLFREHWKTAFADLCRAQGIGKLFKITQGCVIEKLDGSKFQIRNFDKSEPWMSSESLKNIRRIHRSPFRVME